MSNRCSQDMAGSLARVKTLPAGRRGEQRRTISTCLTDPAAHGNWCSRYRIRIDWPASGPIPKGCRLKNAKEE
jgi:hypothetical protein